MIMLENGLIGLCRSIKQASAVSLLHHSRLLMTYSLFNKELLLIVKSYKSFRLNMIEVHIE